MEHDAIHGGLEGQWNDVPQEILEVGPATDLPGLHADMPGDR
jgi:hypothetical protein